MPTIRHKSVRENVLEILKEYPESRGEDKVLLTYYWYLVDGVKFEGIQEFAATFKDATPQGSITRARRYIQYDPRYTGNRYLPEGEVSNYRKWKSDQVKDSYKNFNGNL